MQMNNISESDESEKSNNELIKDGEPYADSLLFDDDKFVIKFITKLNKREEKVVKKIYDETANYYHRLSIRSYLRLGGLDVYGNNIAETLNQFMNIIKKEEEFIKCKHGIRFFFQALRKELSIFGWLDFDALDQIIEAQLKMVVFNKWSDNSPIDSLHDIRIQLSKIYSALMYGGIVGREIESLRRAFTVQLIYGYEVDGTIFIHLTHKLLENKDDFHSLVNIHKGRDIQFTSKDLKARLECYRSLVALSRLIMIMKEGNKGETSEALVLEVYDNYTDWFDVDYITGGFNINLRSIENLKCIPKICETVDISVITRKGNWECEQMHFVVPLLMFAYENIRQIEQNHDILGDIKS